MVIPLQTPEEIKATAEAQPCDRTVLTYLDLSRPPTQKELIQAGNLGEPLTPTFSADASTIQDPAKRARLEQINLAFGHTIQAWNQHRYQEAFELFEQHNAEFPDSPWKAESELHLGCYCQYNGRLMEAGEWFDGILAKVELNSEMYHKAKLRRSILHLDQGNLETSLQGFTEMKRDDKDPSHQTYASYWIREIALLKENEIAMRDCGQKALARVAEIYGDDERATALRELSAAGSHGFTARELHLTATQHGLDSRPVRADTALEDLPLPFVAHYQDQHYVTVEKISKDVVKLYDSRTGQSDIPREAFVKQWSGFALIFSEPVATAGVFPAENLDSIIGGCCGFPRSPSDLGDDGCDKNCGMPGWSVNPVNFNFRVSDTPMWWEPPVGPPVSMSLLFNSLDSLNNVSMFGGKWSFEYSSYLMITPGTGVQVKDGDGQLQAFGGSGTPGVYPVIYASPVGDYRTLKQTADHVFTLEHQDGTIYQYGIPVAMTGNSDVPLLLSITDLHGNAIHITHNAQGAITEIGHTMLPATVATEGQPSSERKWIFTYGTFGGNSRVIRINDPFGRQATFGYDTEGYLRTQADMGGLQYGYDYTTKLSQNSISTDSTQTAFSAATSELFISAIHTPKGTTSILTEPANGVKNLNLTPAESAQGYTGSYPPIGSNHMWTNYRIRITNPENLTEEYHFAAESKVYGYHRNPAQLKPVAGQLVHPAKSPCKKFHYKLVGGTRGKIDLTEIRKDESISQVLSQLVYSTNSSRIEVTGRKDAAGNWTNYRSHPNGTLEWVELPNGNGATNDPQRIDFTYQGNGVDRNEIKRYWNGVQKTLLDVDYWDGTRDVKQTKDVLNHITTYHWHANGLPETIKDETTGVSISYVYDQGSGANNPDNYPTWRLVKVNRITPAVGGSPATTTLLAEIAYDAIGRPAMVMDLGDGYYQPAFDDLNRLKRTDYSDGSFIEQIWECCHVSEIRGGNVVSGVDKVTDRTLMFYDKRGLLVRSIDSGGRITRIGYDEAGRMTTLTDPLNRVTTWTYDVYGRMEKKIYPDTKFEQITWANLVQPYKIKNRRTQELTVGFDGNGNLKTIVGSGVNITRTYDDWDRLKTIKDTAYNTSVHTYDYDLLGRITSLDGPWSDDTLGWNYEDSLRKVTRTSPGSVTEVIVGDTLGRIRSLTNPLGTFTPGYDGETDRALGITHSGGFNTSYSYHGPELDHALESITSKLPNGNSIGKHTYGYDSQGRIETWKREATMGNPVGGTRSFQWKSYYDFSAQLTAVAEKSLSGTLQAGWDYGYDPAGNITTVQNSTGSTAVISNRSHKPTNQIDSIGGGGPTLVRGTLSEAGQVSVGLIGSGDKPARMLSDNRFETELPLVAGPTPNAVSIAALSDISGNRSTYQFDVSITNPSPRSFTYDDDGNLTSDGVRDYQWDILSRLTKITWASGKTTEFKYNALGQRCERIDTNGSTVSRHYYLINGADLIDHRSGSTAATATIDRRYFSQGEQRKNGTNWENHFYCRDHLGSIREVVKSVGGTNTLVARYDYDPYGRRLTQYESSTYAGGCDFGYTGHVTVPSLSSNQTEIVMTLFRAYDSELGIWLSADPLGEAGGMNLYAYVLGNPLNLYDPDGMYPEWAPGSDNYSWGDYWSDVGQVFQGEAKGAASNLSFGLYKPCYENDMENAGGWIGDKAVTTAELLIGAGGVKMGLRQATKQAGKEFSHWVPSRMLKGSKGRLARWFDRSMFNGNMVSPTRHALHDPWRYRFMKRAWKAENPMPNKLVQQLDRIPDAVKATVGGFGSAAISGDSKNFN